MTAIDQILDELRDAACRAQRNAAGLAQFTIAERILIANGIPWDLDQLRRDAVHDATRYAEARARTELYHQALATHRAGGFDR